MNEQGPGGDSVRVAPIVDADVDEVAQLAALVWRHHYPGIITEAQIEYMLPQRYDAVVMRAELQRADIWWDKLVAGDAIVAFASCWRIDNGEMKLDKLYVHPEHQRRGYGGLLIAEVCRRARENNCSQVILAVNKHNVNAIAAYVKHGFEIRDAVVKDIGGGFVMDDYIMGRRP